MSDPSQSTASKTEDKTSLIRVPGNLSLHKNTELYVGLIQWQHWDGCGTHQHTLGIRQTSIPHHFLQTRQRENAKDHPHFYQKVGQQPALERYTFVWKVIYTPEIAALTQKIWGHLTTNWSFLQQYNDAKLLMKEKRNQMCITEYPKNTMKWICEIRALKSTRPLITCFTSALWPSLFWK